MTTSWLAFLKNYVEKRPLVILRFDESEWASLLFSSGGVSEFTIARPHNSLRDIVPPVLCLLIGSHDQLDSSDVEDDVRIGLLTSRGAVTTLDTRVKIKHATSITPKSEDGLLGLIAQKNHLRTFQTKLDTGQPVLSLPPKLGSLLIERIASLEVNEGPLRRLAALLSAPKTFNSMQAIQADAIHTALGAFGLSLDNKADRLEVFKGCATALDRISLREDTVIEHDARHIPDFNLTHSDITGRAIFTNNNEQLEVYTANRGDLESAFGVDLIYLNLKHNSIVLLQYKMLERFDNKGIADWKYTPDSQLKQQIQKMELFSKQHPAAAFEYRLNPNAFYLKFIRRDGAIKSGGIMMPIEHYNRHIKNPSCRGPKGGVRISYNSLSGCYLRQTAFMDLLRSGYIGAYAATTKNFRVLIEAILGSRRAAVAVIHSVKEYQDTSIGSEVDYDPLES